MYEDKEVLDEQFLKYTNMSPTIIWEKLKLAPAYNKT